MIQISLSGPRYGLYLYTHPTTVVIKGESPMFCATAFSIIHFFIYSVLQMNSRFRGAQIFLLHSGELHGQSGLLSCHGGEEN